MMSLDVSKLAAICALRNWTIAAAESCTGGLLSAMITQNSGVSTFFRGSVISYHRGVKQDVLDVSASTIDVMGEVSEPTAILMARGVRAALHSNWAVSITGIAGPGGGVKGKPVGTVCFSVVGPGFEESRLKKFESKLVGDEMRQDIQRQAALFAFEFLLSAMR